MMTSAIIRGASAGTPTASARRGGLAPAIVAAVAAGLQGMAVAALLGGMSKGATPIVTEFKLQMD